MGLASNWLFLHNKEDIVMGYVGDRKFQFSDAAESCRFPKAKLLLNVTVTHFAFSHCTRRKNNLKFTHTV